MILTYVLQQKYFIYKVDRCLPVPLQNEKGLAVASEHRVLTLSSSTASGTYHHRQHHCLCHDDDDDGDNDDD